MASRTRQEKQRAHAHGLAKFLAAAAELTAEYDVDIEKRGDCTYVHMGPKIGGKRERKTD